MTQFCKQTLFVGKLLSGILQKELRQGDYSCRYNLPDFCLNEIHLVIIIDNMAFVGFKSKLC